MASFSGFLGAVGFEWMRERLLAFLTAAYLLLFLVSWFWIGIELLVFEPPEAAATTQGGANGAQSDPSPEQRTVEIPEPVVAIASLLGASVAALAAGVMGIEMQSRTAATMSARAGAAFKSSALLVSCVLAYVLAGGFIITVWMIRDEYASDMIEAFALGTIGFLGGAAAATLRSSP